MGERSASRRYGRLDDARLAALVRKGDAGAFEAIYDRHHAALLAFCRHMLGNLHDAEDVLQQTFLRAHRALRERPAPDALRPWLFAIARNRCLTLLAARRESADAPEGFEPGFDGLAEDVARRADLRELVGDLARLPDEQREALVLFELGGSSQAEIAGVLGCPPAKVKALVFQARSTLIAERDARSMPCEAIRRQLSVARGGVLRRGSLRRHVRQCAPCDAYRLAVAGQRERFAVLLPVLPTAGLKAAVLAAAGLTGGGSAAAAAGGAASLGGATGGGSAGGAASAGAVAGGGAGSAGGAASVGAVAGGGAASAGGLAATALVAKVAVTVAVAGAGVSGAVAAVHSARDATVPQVRAAAPAPTRAAAKPTRPAPSRPAPANGAPVSAPASTAPVRTTPGRRAIRRHRVRRARRAAFRRRVLRARRQAQIARATPRRAARRAARRDARQQARRNARQEVRRDARRNAARPDAAPRPTRPRRPARGAQPLPAPAGARPVRRRPHRPVPTPGVTAPPIPSATPAAAPTP
jgi:RNA polymerase sigma factor (sigma-70 family)